MSQYVKKSLEWLKPLTLNQTESEQFMKSVSQKPSEAVLKIQQSLFDVAKKLRRR